MFEIATLITYDISRDDLKDAEMEIFKLEFDHKPKTEMIKLHIDDGDKIFSYFYKIKEEYNKWYFVAL